MCLSATASFVTGAALSVTGLYCLNMSRGAPRLLPVAATPLLFGLQQIAEGFVWHGLGHGDTLEAVLGAKAYLFFAMGLWLGYLPLSVSFLEPRPRRRLIIRVISMCGLLFGALLYLPIALDIPGGELLEVTTTEGSIAYYTNTIIQPSLLSNLIYLLFTPATLVATTHERMQTYAFLLFLSAVATRFVVANTWTSVWCFIAALLSLYLVHALRRELTDAPPSTESP